MAKPAIGFGSEVATGDDEEAIKRMFTPEFRNRLDAVISFAALTPETIGRVVDKFILQLEEQLADRNVTIVLDDAAREWLGAKGYDKLFGARPLGRVIQEHVKKPLAEELLFGKLVKGGVVKVSVDDDKLAFAFEEAAAPPTRAARRTRRARGAERAGICGVGARRAKRLPCDHKEEGHPKVAFFVFARRSILIPVRTAALALSAWSSPKPPLAEAKSHAQPDPTKHHPAGASRNALCDLSRSGAACGRDGRSRDHNGESGSAFAAFDGELSGTMLSVLAPRLVVQSWRSVNFAANDPRIRR